MDGLLSKSIKVFKLVLILFVPGQFPEAAGAVGAGVGGAHGVAGAQADSKHTRGGGQRQGPGLRMHRLFLLTVPNCAKEGSQQQE